MFYNSFHTTASQVGQDNALRSGIKRLLHIIIGLEGHDLILVDPVQACGALVKIVLPLGEVNFNFSLCVPDQVIERNGKVSGPVKVRGTIGLQLKRGLEYRDKGVVGSPAKAVSLPI